MKPHAFISLMITHSLLSTLPGEDKTACINNQRKYVIIIIIIKYDLVEDMAPCRGDEA